MRKTLSLFLALTLVFCLSVPAAAADDATGTTLRLQETTGTVTVKTSSGQKKSVTKGMRLYNGYIIETGSSSSAFVNLDDTKAVKLGANGKVEIKKSGKQLEVCLSVGELFFNVTEKLASTEKLKISTSTTITGIRGTSGWARQIGSARTQIAILEGNATVTGVAAPDASLTAAPASAEVGAGEKLDVTVSEDGAPAVMETTPIAAGDLSAMVTEQIAVDPKLQEKVSEAMPELNMTELVESLPEKQAEEAAQEAEAQAALDTRSAEQEQTIAETAAEDKAAGVKDTIAFEPARESSGSGGGGGSSGGGSPSSYTATAAPASTAELQQLLNTYTTVTIPTPASGVSYTGGVTVPAGHTLIIAPAPGASRPDLDHPFAVGGLTNNGTIIVQPNAALSLIDNPDNSADGTHVNNGTIIVQGELDNLGTLDNTASTAAINVEGHGLFQNGGVLKN